MAASHQQGRAERAVRRVADCARAWLQVAVDDAPVVEEGEREEQGLPDALGDEGLRDAVVPEARRDVLQVA